MLFPTAEERGRRDAVMQKILHDVQSNRVIKLPPFDASQSAAGEHFALQAIEDNDYSGTIGPYRYQFEGEEDLLHLIVVRTDAGRLTAEQARDVADIVLLGLPPGLVWLKPGEFSQHFYFGHDELLQSLVI